MTMAFAAADHSTHDMVERWDASALRQGGRRLVRACVGTRATTTYAEQTGTSIARGLNLDKYNPPAGPLQFPMLMPCCAKDGKVRERGEPSFTAGAFRRRRPGPSRSAGLQTAALHERIQETVKYRRGQLT